MGDKIFLDTNILADLFSVDEPDKRNRVFGLIDQYNCMTGLNNINELTNVLVKKFKIPFNDISKAIEQVANSIKVVGITLETIKSAIQIAETYKFAYYDSLVIACALENKCNILYSEDMQHQQVINNLLTIINIFTGCS